MIQGYKVSPTPFFPPLTRVSPGLCGAKELENSAHDRAQIDMLRCFHRVRESSNLTTAQISFDDGWMHITFATNGRCVAEKLCHCTNCCLHICLALFLRVEPALRVECDR